MEAIRFDNSTDNLLITMRSEDFTADTVITSLTVCAWFLVHTIGAQRQSASVDQPLVYYYSHHGSEILYLQLPTRDSGVVSFTINTINEEPVIKHIADYVDSWHHICGVWKSKETCTLYFDGEKVNGRSSGVESVPPGYLILGGYTYSYGEKAIITFHGLMAGVKVWVNKEICIPDETCHIASEVHPPVATPSLLWSVDNIYVTKNLSSMYKNQDGNLMSDYSSSVLEVSANDFSLMFCSPTTTTTTTTTPTTTTTTPKQSTTTLHPILQFIRSANHSTVVEGEPIIPKKIHEAKEAPRAVAFGATGLIIVGVIIGLIMASDLHYFRLVIPLCKRRFKSGVKRFRRRMHGETFAGMQQMISLTMGLSNMDAGNPKSRKNTVLILPASKVSQPVSKESQVDTCDHQNVTDDDIELALLDRNSIYDNIALDFIGDNK